jgi:FMN phosphatase YigB (HAD superfamily)
MAIKVVLFDLDDTLLNTSQEFFSHIDRAVEQMASYLGCQAEGLNSRLQTALYAARARNNVNPAPLWAETFGRLREYYPDIPTVRFDTAINIALLEIDKIYCTEISIKPGALELIKYLISKGVRVGIVTHALPDWSLYKLLMAKLLTEGLLSFENVFTVPVDIPKNKAQWQLAIDEYNGITPSEIMIVGDNPHADILPVIQIGADRDESFRVYRLADGTTRGDIARGAGELPKDKYIEIGSLEELLQILQSSEMEMQLR